MTTNSDPGEQSLEPRLERLAPGVDAVRSSRRGPSVAPPEQTPAEIEAWLVGPAIEQTDFLLRVEELVWRCVAAGLPIDRLTLHVGALHPQLVGIGWRWSRAVGAVEEIQVSARSIDTDGFRRNPLHDVIMLGQTVRARPAEDLERWSMMRELAEQGLSDYVAAPLRTAGARHNAATFATCRPGGFGRLEYDTLLRLLRMFAFHVDQHIQLRTATTLLEVYLGAEAARRVLDGAIRRGAGERLNAIVWMADLRNSTALADRLAPEDWLAVLDAAFEVAAGAVMAESGEVLKFLGDGLLAVFPIDPADDGRAAAASAVAAARATRAGLAALSARPPERLAAIEGWRPLAAGVGLHAGDVFFGNVGAPSRLDFTVIGPAVNLASRIEGLCKEVGRDILMSDAVAARLDEGVAAAIGAHAIRGRATPLALFAVD